MRNVQQLQKYLFYFQVTPLLGLQVENITHQQASPTCTTQRSYLISTSKKKISFDDGNSWNCKRGPKIPQNTECCHWSFSVVRIRCSNTWSKQCRFSAFNPVERRMVPLSNDLFLLHSETISMGMGKPLTSTFKKGTSSRLLRCFLIYGLRL